MGPSVGLRVYRLTQLCNVAEWIMTHTDVAHLFKGTEGEQRVSMCGRLFAVSPAEKFDSKCAWCQGFENRMKCNSGARHEP